MVLNRQRLEEGRTDEDGSEPNTDSTDELAAFSSLARGAGEVMIIRILQRNIERIVVPIMTPLIRQVVSEQIGLARQELLTCLKANLANKAITSVPRKLKLKFINKISLPVFTGKPLLGENATSIEIALVDALTEEVVNTGTESTAKLEIVGFRVGDNDGNEYDHSWTFEDFQKIILSEKKGKRILQGDASSQLNEGVCVVGKISFTHNAENMKNGLYRLGVGVVDAALMNGVEVARTEAFFMKDKRYTYYEKHPCPSLSDKVCHLLQINYKGARYKRLKDAGVNTVNDLLTLLYTDPKRLEDILKGKASYKIWDDIINNAKMSNGMFLCLDPSNDRKTGVVLNVKLQLMGLITETRQYIPVDQLSDQQKVDNQNLVNLASKHFEMVQSFEDETCLKKYLHTGIGSSSIPSANQSLGISDMTSKTTKPSSHVNSSSSGLTEALNLHMDQTTTQAPIGTTRSERGKEMVPFDDEMICYQEYISNHLLNVESLIEPLNYTEAGTSSQTVKSPFNPCGHVNNFSVLEDIIQILTNDFNEWYSKHLDNEASTMAAQPVSVCTSDSARTRWIKASKLLRRNSVRERVRRISPTEGIQVLKKQRCF